MKTCSMEITISVQDDFADNASEGEIRERLGDLVDGLIEGSDLVSELIRDAEIKVYS